MHTVAWIEFQSLLAFQLFRCFFIGNTYQHTKSDAYALTVLSEQSTYLSHNCKINVINSWSQGTNTYLYTIVWKEYVELTVTCLLKILLSQQSVRRLVCGRPTDGAVLRLLPLHVNAGSQLTSCIICCSYYQCSLHLHLFPSTTPSSTVSSDWLPCSYFHFNLYCYFLLLSEKLLFYNHVFTVNMVFFCSTPAYKITSSCIILYCLRSSCIEHSEIWLH